MKWQYCLKIISLSAVITLAGCDVFEDNDEDAALAPIGVGGAGVKGPLVGADVNLYLADLTAADLKGELQGEGTTGTDASIQDLEVPGDISGLVLLEFLVVAATTDLTTGAAPIFDNLITVVDAQRLVDGDDVYASVLTTMAVNLAIASGATTEAEFLTALETAQNQVKSTLGFGLDDTTDIFTTPPLITDDTTSAEDQASVAAYRQAIEAVAAIADAVSTAGGGATPQEALEALTEDLSDGDIDGQGTDGAIADLATVATLTTIVTQDVTLLVIPGTTTTVGDIEAVLASETADTGSTTNTDDLASGDVSVDPEPAQVDVDIDGDGVTNAEDAFPEDETETVDTDGDQVGDNADAFPEDATEDTDTDEDGVGDNGDAFPEDDSETLDTDGDQVGDNADAFPDDADNQTDADEDGLGDETLDEFLDDTDNDGIPNGQDDFNVPNDSDNDGVADDTDNCVDVFNPDQANADGDAAGDACETDLPGLIWDTHNWDEALWQDAGQA